MGDDSRDNSSTDRDPKVPEETGASSDAELEDRPDEADPVTDDETGDEEQVERSARPPVDDLRALESVLRRTGRDLRRPVILEGTLWYGTTVLAVILTGLLVAGFLPEYGYTVGRWVMTLGTASVTVGAGVALAYYWWRGPTIDDVAARIQRHSSQFRNDLVAALEFGRGLVDDDGASLANQGTSAAMAREHLGRTLRKVYDECDHNSLEHCVPAREMTPPVLAFSGAVALMLIPLVLNPGWTLGVITGERVGAPVVGERVVEEMIVGGLEGVFVYPSYTGQDRQFRDLGTGRIESLEGTEIHLHATLMPGDWASVEMVVETGDDESEPEVHELALDGGHRASTSLTLDESGHYWFRGETMEGRPVEDRAKRRIEVRKDNPPTIEVTSHEGRIDVEADDVIEFEIEASDDFGIDSIRQIYHFQGSPDDPERERLEIGELAEEPTSLETTARLDLAPLDLQPKDAIAVYFEARDINTATGPNTGESEPVVLYIESPEDKHLENIARQQEISERMLGHLADVLEAPAGRREVQDDGTYRQRVEPGLDGDERFRRYERTNALYEQRDSLVEAIDEVTEEIEDDPMMVPRNLTMFQGIGDRLDSLQDEGQEVFAGLSAPAQRRDLTAAHVQQVADYAAESERELEHSVLALDELLVEQKMALVEQTADQIEEKRDRLRDLLEQYRDTDDPELREAIQREIERLRQRLRELMSRMQMQIREMPQEHVNLEAMQDMDMEADADSLGDQLDAIDDMIADGDIDSALEALEDFEAELGDMSNEMQDSFSQMQPQGISEFDEAVGEMMDEVTHLREMQQEVEGETSQLQDDLREERREQLDRMLEPVTRELLEEIGAQQRDLDTIEERPLPDRDQADVDRASRGMDRLQEMVEQRDLEQSLESARSVRDMLRSMQNTMSLSERYVDEGSDAEGALRESIDDADEMIERGDRIERRIEEFIEEAEQNLQPGEEERFDELAEEQEAIHERTEDLHGEIEGLGEEYPQLLEELGPPIGEASEAMEGAGEELGERRAQRSLDDQRRALEQLEELGDSMDQAMQQQRQQEREESGRARGDDEEVEIPGEDSGEVRERIREEMMEGMRDGRLEEYESEIERYFRSLVE